MHLNLEANLQCCMGFLVPFVLIDQYGKVLDVMVKIIVGSKVRSSRGSFIFILGRSFVMIRFVRFAPFIAIENFCEFVVKNLLNKFKLSEEGF